MSIVLVAAAVSGLGGSCAARPALPVTTPAGVRFTLAYPNATSVALAGSFNQWSSSSHPLTRTPPSGVWTIVVPLPTGQHLFMYVVDGTHWVSPPIAEDYEDDGFGARNGVVVVRPRER